MAGLSANGLEIKRLQDVVSDRIASARSYFGSDAKTSSNDVLGRALRIASPSEADTWQLAEAVYLSFFPEFATGVSLDRIVAYAGLTRFDAAPSTAALLVTGDYNVVIPNESFVESSVTTNRFVTTSSTQLNDRQVSGFTIQVIAAADNADYIITTGASSFTYTTGTGETLADIASGIASIINNSTSEMTASVVNDVQVRVTFDDVFVRRDTSITANMSFQKIQKVVPAECTELGPISQPANTIDQVSSPITGWDSVTNPQPVALGRFRETDEELRIRFANSKELNARGTIDSIFSTLLGVVGVEEVQVYENETNGVDAIGLPPKSFSAVVLGGSAQQIAEAIWEVKPAGVEAFGNTTVTVVDSQGLPHDISFSRPETVNIYIDLVISPFENQSIASNTPELIIDALEEYFRENYRVGDDVIYSRLYTPINSAASGYQIDSLSIGTSPNPTGMGNVTINFDQIAQLLRGNVNITVSVN
jgi:uncharacterized phage protein gp47/JayE